MAPPFVALPLTPSTEDTTGARDCAARQSSVDSKPVQRRSLGSSCSLNHRTVKDADHVLLIHRIMIMLSSPKARAKISMVAFEKHADVVEPQGGKTRELPVARLPLVLKMLEIPTEHLNIFEAVLQREMNFDPKVITFELFQKLLPKALRRIRDLYCVPFSKGQFVTRNPRQLEDGYERLCAVGTGSFGNCFRVRHLLSGKVRVVKEMRKVRLEMPREEVEQELNILKELDHPNIVRFFEWFESESSFLLVLELAHGGDLKKALCHAQATGACGLSEGMIQSICEQCLGALEYIHGQRVIHRDLKPANMLLLRDTSPPHLLLADFGIADVFGHAGDNSQDSITLHSSEKKGTWPYMAPEIFDDKVSPKSDVWGLGVVSYELFCGVKPFGVDPFEVYNAISVEDPVDVSPVLQAGGSDMAGAFVSKLLTKDESIRPTAQEAQMEFQDWWDEALASPIQRRNDLLPFLTDSMDEFRATSTFTKAALLCAASQLDTSAMETLHDTFKALDVDKNGTLSVSEFMSGFDQLGYDADHVEAIVDALDINATAKIEYTEFITGCLGANRHLAESGLVHAFRIFDINGDGVISMEEFREILGADGTLAAMLPDGKTFEQELDEIDTSHDKQISFEEFKAYMEKAQLNSKKNLRSQDATETVALPTLLPALSSQQVKHSKAVNEGSRRKLQELTKMRDWLRDQAQLSYGRLSSLQDLERQVEAMSSTMSMILRVLHSSESGAL